MNADKRRKERGTTVSMELQNRVALITGAARGIGAAIAQHLSDAGAKIAIADLDGDGAKETSKNAQNARNRSIGRCI